MKSIIRPATLEDKAALWTWLQEYLDELLRFGSVNKDYPFFDSYWTDATRWPYIIESNDQAIGFAFVNQYSPFGRDLDFFLAEFYIRPAYRKKEYGAIAANAVMARHPGRWELSYFKKNHAAAAFWPKVLSRADYQCIEHKDVLVMCFSIQG